MVISHGEKTLPGSIRTSDLKPSRSKVICTITLHYIEGMGWLIATLPISRGSRRQQAFGLVPRTYAIAVDDGALYSIGLGPHIKRTVVVHITKLSKNRLGKYRDLHDEGMAQASAIRDQIGSRRINAVARRLGMSL